MTVRREMSGTQVLTYTQGWTVDNRLAVVVKSDLTGTILATTTITYDLLGRKLGIRDPDMGVWGYQYDGNNNLTRQTDARGQQIQFLFDALNRPIETRDVNASWTLEKRYYDEAGYGQSKGRRTRAEAYVGNALNNTIATSYDARGRVTLDRRSIGGENYDTDFGYDSANRVTGYRYPSQDSYVIQGYNSLSQPFSLCQSLAIEGFGANGVPDRKPPKDDCDWYVAAAYYNALGKSTEIQLGNGLSQRTNYFGLDTPTWFGPGQFGRTRQISGSRRTRMLQISQKRSRLPARTLLRNLQRPCPP